MSRRQSGVPQTPAHNDDALERSLRRQSSNRVGYSISETARRVQESPLRREIRRGPVSANSSALGGLGDAGSMDLAAPSSTQSQTTPVDAAEFQEWMKMVRLKRVKANNAFTIQLIDAFHGMVRGEILSQDGEVLTQTADGVTFQEASHTLGGCVTVYRSRIARVKDDTSKLLEGFNGNAENRERNGNGENAENRGENDPDGNYTDGNNGDSDGSDEQGRGKAQKSKQRSNSSNGMSFLSAPEKLEIDTNELATTIDPLLRKMAADFDKRGAEALLQYSLKLDYRGRLWLGSETDDSRPSSTANNDNETHAEEPEAPIQPPRRKLSMIQEAAEEAIDDLEGTENALRARNKRMIDDDSESDTETNEEHNGDGDDSNDVDVSNDHSTDGDESNDDDESNEDDESNDDDDPNDGDYSNEDDGQPLSIDLAHFNVNYFSGVDFSTKETLPLVDSIIRAVSNPTEGTDKLIRDMQAWAIADPGDDCTYHIDEDVEANEDEDGEIYENNNNELIGLGLNAADWDQGGQDDMGIEIDDPANSFGPGYDMANTSANESLNSMVSNRMPVSGNWMDIENLQSLDVQKNNWAGPSFWKIRRLQSRVVETGEDGSREGSVAPGEAGSANSAAAAAKKRRALANVPTVIDFNSDESVDFDSLTRSTAKSITLRKNQFLDNHLTPVDMHVSTRQLIALSLRPRTGIARAFRRGAWGAPRHQRRHGGFDDTEYGPGHDLSFGGGGDSMMDGEMSYGGVGGISGINHTFDPSNPIDDNFFHTGWEAENPLIPHATTAAELFSQSVPQSGYGGTGNQLNFSKVAKRVDVRRLKDNVWRAIHNPEVDENANVGRQNEEPQTEEAETEEAEPEKGETEKERSEEEQPEEPVAKHTLLQVIRDTQPLYSEQQRSDLSPALYFISLLHLSNEKGLTLKNMESLTDIEILERPTEVQT